MAILNTQFYQGEDGYSDGAIERELLSIVKGNTDFDEVLRNDCRWPLFYHLSPLRENVFNWYSFDPNAALLEIGGGCGALTGLFCRKVKSVKTIELTKSRSDVNYERNKDFDNLEIIVGNFKNIQLQERFDYIILNGVLEYAGSFIDGETPYISFLEDIKALLKPTGTLLLSIENRLGIKYLNGAVEDHTAQLFSGVNGYVGINSVKTFSKEELKHLLRKVGFNAFDFYYPVPDYKFPEVIYSENHLEFMNNNIRNNTYNSNRLMFYDEDHMMESLKNEGIAGSFFNSFIVEVHNDEKIERSKKTIYAKMGNDRKKEFQIITKIEEDQNKERSVYKLPMTEESEKHLDEMKRYFADHENNHSLFENVSLNQNCNGYSFAYIKGNTLEKQLLDDLKNNEFNTFKANLVQFKSEVLKDTFLSSDYCTKEFKTVFGDMKCDVELHCKRNSNIDLIFPNIFVQDNRYYIIDYEWTFAFDIPQEYVVWRSLYFFYLANDLVKKIYSFEQLLEIVGIDKTLHTIFCQWDLFFGNRYVRDNINEHYEKEIIWINDDLDYLLKYMGKIIETALYFDYGEGFSEKNRLDGVLEIHGADFTASFIIDETYTNGKRIETLRWDPAETACVLSEVKIIENENDLEILQGEEAIQIGSEYYYITDDPNCIILGDYKGIRTLKISGKIEILHPRKVIGKLKDFKNAMMAQRDQAVACAMQEADKYKTMYESVTNSHIWKNTETLRKMSDQLRKK